MTDWIKYALHGFQSERKSNQSPTWMRHRRSRQPCTKEDYKTQAGTATVDVERPQRHCICEWKRHANKAKQGGSMKCQDKCREAVYRNLDALFFFFCVPYSNSDVLGTTKKEKEKRTLQLSFEALSLQYPTSANSSMNHVPTPSPGPRTHRYPL